VRIKLTRAPGLGRESRSRIPIARSEPIGSSGAARSAKHVAGEVDAEAADLVGELVDQPLSGGGTVVTEPESAVARS